MCHRIVCNCDHSKSSHHAFCKSHLANANDPRQNISKWDPYSVNRIDPNKTEYLADYCEECEAELLEAYKLPEDRRTLRSGKNRR